MMLLVLQNVVDFGSWIRSVYVYYEICLHSSWMLILFGVQNQEKFVYQFALFNTVLTMKYYTQLCQIWHDIFINLKDFDSVHDCKI